MIKPVRSFGDELEVDAEDYLSRTIFEPDETPSFTGLLDAGGNELYAVNEIGSIGYLAFKAK